MTIIAFDGKTISADGFTTCGNEIVRTDYKKLYGNIGQYKAVAFTGNMSKVESIVQWIIDGEKKTDLDFKADYTVVLIDKDHRVYSVDMNKGFDFKFREADKNNAWGCGCDYAIGAMLAGANSHDAVKIACSKDVYCGGTILTHCVLTDKHTI